MLSLVVVSTWMNMGSATLIYLAALQGIPGELYEAAELDGAGVLRADLARHHPADPADPVADADAADRRDDAGVHRGVHADRRRTRRDSTTTVVYLHLPVRVQFNNFNTAAALGVIMLLVLAIFSAHLPAGSAAERD